MKKPNYFPFAVPLARRKEMRDIISPGPAGVSAAENGGVIGVADNSVCYGKSVRSVARVVDHIVLHIFFGCVHDLAHCAALYRAAGRLRRKHHGGLYLLVQRLNAVVHVVRELYDIPAQRCGAVVCDDNVCRRLVYIAEQPEALAVYDDLQHHAGVVEVIGDLAHGCDGIHKILVRIHYIDLDIGKVNALSRMYLNELYIVAGEAALDI